jgi:serine protease Do
MPLFSIPSNDVKESLRQILEKGRPVHGFLGVRLHTVDDRVRQLLGYDQPNGSLVTDVVPESPAARAGLQVRDVIMEFNEKPVQSAPQLISMLQRTPVGREVPLKVWRAGTTLTLSTSVAENIAINPPQVNLSSADAVQLIRKIGVSVRSFTDMERSRGFSGAVVTEVQPEGPAAAYLKENDVIIAVNQTKIESAEQFYQHFLSSISQQSTQLTLIRERSARIVTMPKSES